MNKDQTIQPIGQSQQLIVREHTTEYLSRAASLYDYEFEEIPVYFDLKGRAAGMYKVANRRRCIRYNPYVFARYFSESLQQTVPHEVAHYVADQLYGAHRIKPHGQEWQAIMHDFGVKARATGRYDLTGIPVRRQQRHDYRCGCRQHQISSVRHNRILKRQAEYFCRYCGSALVAGHFDSE